jgi:hypothetical protein
MVLRTVEPPFRCGVKALSSMEMIPVAPSVQNPYQPRFMMLDTSHVLLHHPMSSKEVCHSLFLSMDNNNLEIKLNSGIITILRSHSLTQTLVPRKVVTSSRSEVRISNPSERMRVSLIFKTPLSVISLLLEHIERLILPTQPELHAKHQSPTISESQPLRSLLMLPIVLMTELFIIITNPHSFSMPSPVRVQFQEELKLRLSDLTSVIQVISHADSVRPPSQPREFPALRSSASLPPPSNQVRSTSSFRSIKVLTQPPSPIFTTRTQSSIRFTHHAVLFPDSLNLSSLVCISLILVATCLCAVSNLTIKLTSSWKVANSQLS